MANTLLNRVPLVAVHGRSTPEAIDDADVVVLETGGEEAYAAAAAGLRRGQLLLVTQVVGVGVTRDRLVVPLEARDVELGIEAFVAIAPAGAGPRVVAGATPECADRAAALIEGMDGQALVVASLEAAELSGLHRDLAGAEVLAEAACAAERVEEALEELGIDREEARVLVVGAPDQPAPALLAILERRGVRAGFAYTVDETRLEPYDLVFVLV